MKLSDLHGRRVVFWGAGRETTSLAKYLERNDIEIELLATVVDRPSGSMAEHQLGARAPVVAATRARRLLDAADVIVRSPVVQPTRREIRARQARGAVVTTATAMWIAEHRGIAMTGVTGSKGKTTTTALIGHLLSSQGLNVEVAGNTGRPVTDIDPGDELDHVVLELSSFQLNELTYAPRIAVYTNFLREHDGWHRGTDRYLEAKLNMCRRPGAEHVVVEADDLAYSALNTSAQRHLFGGAGEYVVTDDVVRHERMEVLTCDDLPLPGRHNLLNAAAALTAVAAAGHRVDDPRAALAEFEPPARRLAVIADDDGVLWVDDVHSSAPESAVAAARAFDGPVTLIVGGRLRGQDHGQLTTELFDDPELRLVLFESGGRTIHADAIKEGVDPDRVAVRSSLAAAIRTAELTAPRPSTVILSPIGLMEDPAVPVLARSEEFRALVARLVDRSGLAATAAG